MAVQGNAADEMGLGSIYAIPKLMMNAGLRI